MNCVKCNSTNIIKYGKRNGNQCFLCKSCSHQFTNSRTFIENEKRAAITLYCFGLSLRKIANFLLYSHVTIHNWIKEFELNYDTPKEDYFMELDELSKLITDRNENPQGRRFKTMQSALTWNIENEISKQIEKIFSELTVE